MQKEAANSQRLQGLALLSPIIFVLQNDPNNVSLPWEVTEKIIGADPYAVTEIRFL